MAYDVMRHMLCISITLFATIPTGHGQGQQRDATRDVNVLGIGCFVCSSIDGSEPDCEDVFNNTGRFYQFNCMAARKTRAGVFPASSCVKLKGTIDATGATYVVRACVVDSGGVNSETELARSDHCGLVKSIELDDQIMSGCVLSCNTNGCNAARPRIPPEKLAFIALLLLCKALTFYVSN